MIQQKRAPGLKVLETDRSTLRWPSSDDAPFILGLLNDPCWLQFISDNGVRTLDHAQSYLSNGPIAMYALLCFGLYLAELKEVGIPIGICGLIKRGSKGW